MSEAKTQQKVHQVMSEFKQGELNIGRSKKKAKKRKQAKLDTSEITLNEAGISRRDSFNIPDNHADLYITTVLEAVRGDATKKIWVKNSRVKGGGYYRQQRVSDKQPEAKPKTGQKLSAPARRGNGVVGGLIAGAAIAGAGAAAVAFAQKWQSEKGVRSEIEKAKAGVEKRLQEEIAKRQSGNSTRNKLIATGIAGAAIAGGVAANEFKKRSQAEATEKQAVANAEQLQKQVADLENERSTKMQEMESEHQKRLSDLETQYKGKTAESEVEYQKKSAELDTAHQKRLTDLTQEVEQKKKNLERNAAKEIEKRTEANRAQIQEASAQEVERLRTQFESEAQQKIAEERESARALVENERRKATMPKPSAPGSIAYDKNGISLEASKLYGKFDPNLMTDASMKQRITKANQGIAEELRSDHTQQLTNEFKERMQEIDRKYGVSVNDNPSRKKQQNLANIRWQAMERALLQQGQREKALDSHVEEVEAKYRDLHQQAWLDQVAASDGNVSEEAMKAFDRESKKLAAQMKRELDQRVRESRQRHRLDSRDQDPEYRRAYKEFLKRA